MKTAVLLACAGSALLCGCSNMVISTGTTIGLKATPGDGSTQTPQVTFGYKRMELAYVPVDAASASKAPPPRKGAKPEDPSPAGQNKSPAPGDVDAFSALAVIDVQTKWFGRTVIKQFISSGIAARDISTNENFSKNFAVFSGPQSTPVKTQAAEGLKELEAKSSQLKPEEKNRLEDQLREARTENQVQAIRETIRNK